MPHRGARWELEVGQPQDTGVVLVPPSVCLPLHDPHVGAGGVAPRPPRLPPSGVVVRFPLRAARPPPRVAVRHAVQASPRVEDYQHGA